MAEFAWESVDAIRDYMNSAEAELRKSPKGSKLLDDFRKWYASLGIIDHTIRAETRLSEAKWYRNTANAILGRKLPEGWVPADNETSSIGKQIPAASNDPTPKESLIPTWAKVTGGILAGLLVWHLFSHDDDE